MKNLSQMLKRTLASFLAVLMVMTAGNFGFVASVFAHNADYDHEHVSLGKLIVNAYDELTEDEKLIITSGQLQGDNDYHYVVPNPDNGDGRIAVDEETKEITAGVYTDKSGNEWYPTTFALVVDDAVEEEGDISDGTATYGYTGNAFSVKVTYVLKQAVSEEDQKAVLEAGSKLALDIAKLMLLEADIIPAKPEGWDEMTQTEKENHKDYEEIVKYDALQKFVDSATSQAAGSHVKLTPKLVLTLMTLPVLDYGDESGLSVVDLLAMLAGIEYDNEAKVIVDAATEGVEIGGVTVPAALIDALDKKLEVLEYDEDTGKIGATIGITRPANKEAAGNLLTQKAEDGTLLMGKFLRDHGADSYLEWLMVAATYAELVEAVTGNYEDLEQLATNTRALPGVLEDMQALYDDVVKLENAAWKMISTTAAEYGLTIENETQLNNALTPAGFDELLASQMGPLNEKLDDLKKALADNGYTAEAETIPAEITTKAELESLIATLKGVKADAESKQTLALEMFNSELKGYGYTGTVKVDTMADDIAAVESWLTSRITAEQDKITDAIDAANTVLTGTGYTVGTVDPVGDIEDAITGLTNSAGDELKAAQQLVADKLAAANTLAQSFGYPTKIVDAAGVDAVAVWLQEQIDADKAELQSYIDLANSYITEANKELPEGQKYTGTIAEPDDIDDVITWMGEQVTAAEQAYADALADLNTKLDDMGYTGTDVTGPADFDENGKVQKWIDEQVAELDQLHADACVAINKVLNDNGITDKTVDEAADLKKLLDAFDEAYATLNATLDPYEANFQDCPKDVTNVGQLDEWIAAVELANSNPWRPGAFNDALAKMKELRPTYEQIDTLRPPVTEAYNGMMEIENAKAKLTGEEMTNTLAELKATLTNAEAEIANAKAMVEEYTDTLNSAKNKMISMKQDIADAEAALPGQKDQLAAAKAAVVAAEEALAEVDDPSATLIPALREQQGIINEANAKIDTYEDQQDSVDEWKSNLNTITGALDTLSGAITAMEDGLAAANEAYATLEGVAESLQDLKDTKAQLNSTISMMNTLITMLELFCATIEPIYDSCNANDWNVRDVLVDYNANADYDALTEAATGLEAPAIEVVESLYVTEADVTFKMSMWDVTVEYQAVVVDPSKTDSTDTLALTTKTQKVTLVDGATAEDILNAIAEKLPAEDTYLTDWAISTDNYDRTADALPETLTENITYVIKYAPKMLTMTYGAGFEGGELPAEVPYGYRMTLPAHDDVLYEWEYTVNGESKIRQGTVVTIVEGTEISRKAGAASEQYKLTDLVIETTPALTANEKAILQSLALKLNKVVYVRMPNGSLVTVARDSELGQTTVTAEPYDSNVAGNWTVSTGLMDGAPVTFTNGVFTTSEVFQQIVASYKLYMTAAQLGVTDEVLEEYLNAPYILSSDYHFQKSTLDTLVASLTIDDPQDEGSDAAPLEALALLRKDYTVPFNGQNLLLGNLLGSLPTLNESLGMGLSDTTIQAAADLLAILPESGNVPLYDTLMLYQSDKGGMEHYYKNEQTYINQITQLSGLMNALTGDATLMGMLGGYKAQFDVINNALKTAAALGEDENRIRTDLINVNSPALSNLLDALAEGDVSAHAAPDKLEWTVNITKAGPTSKSYTVKVDVFGNVKSETYVVGIDDAFNHEADQLTILTGNNMIPAADMMYYQYAVSETTDDEGNPVYTYTYSYKWFAVGVQMDGQDVYLGEVSMEQTMITLPVHPDSENFRWDYVVDGKAYSAGGNVELTTGQFKALVNGELSITRTLVDLEQERLEQEEEEKRKQEQQLIADLGGLGVMTKIEEGKYALVLNLNIDDPKSSLMGFVVSLVTNPYDSILLGSTELYAVEDYGDKAPKQIHLQALIDLILNSGLTDDALLGMIANGAFKNDFTLPGTYIEMDGEGNPIAYGDLGTQFVQSTLTFQKADKDDLVVDFYVTLSGSGDMVGTLQSALSSLPESVSMELNGGVTLSADLPGMIYTAYLAALSMVGEVDLDNMDAATSEVVIGYVYDLLNPVLGNNAVTVTTIENTLALFDIEEDLSAYESYYNLVKRAYGVTPVYTDNGFKVVLSDVDISSVIAQMQGMVDTMELPGGMKLNLANLIYEYDDPAYDDDEFGLDVVIGAGLGNIDAEYNVVYVDVKAEGLSNKFGMTTADKLALQATSVVVLVGNVEGDLVFNGTTTFVDLNGYTVSGNIVGNGGDVIVVDSDYTANGGANGVSGNVTVLGGKYAVTLAEENLGKGYQQAADGTVGNRLFTVVETDDTITVTLNATPEDVKSLLSQRGVIELAAEVLVDLVINHYNAAALSVDGNTIYNINFNDLLALATGTRDDLIDTALACISVSDLADVFNAIVADLTNFQGMADALAEGGDGIVSKHDFTTATWAMALGHDTEKDVLTLNLGASDEKTETKTLQLAIVGDARDDMAILTAALADTVTVESNLDLDDLVRANGKLAVNGSYAGSVIVDFVHNPGYALAMAVIVADGTPNAALKADVVAGIESYAVTGDMLPLGEVFNALSIKDICDALVNHIDEFDDMVVGLGLSTEAEAVIAANVAENEMGYKLLVDVVSYALFLLDSREIGETITDSGRTLGSFEKEDDKGLYYGFEKSGSIDKTVSVLDVTMDITNATVKVYLFPDHTCGDVNADHYCDGCDVKLSDCDDANEDHYCDYAGCAKKLSECDDANEDHYCDYAGCQIKLTDCTDADENHYCDLTGCQLKISDCTDADENHYCDMAGCQLKLSDCTDADENHYCDLTGCQLKVSDCADANEDHYCDYVGCQLKTSDCTDADANHYCDYVGCAKKLSECADANADHYCDSEGCKLKLSECVDADENHYCDYVGCQLKTSEHTDADENHYCDLTGCQIKISECVDANADHYCDLTGCQLKVSDCADANADHYCDSEGCKLKLSECTDADENHYCDLTGCQLKISECTDADENHYCDLTGCQLKTSECTDANEDHYCDLTGCQLKTSECTDANEDHYCDLTGCQLKTSECVDVNADHYCDLTGCAKKLSECVDANNDHYCDSEGCQIKLTDCVDANDDYHCDICGKLVGEQPVVGVPEIPVSGDVIGFKADADEGLLYLDTIQEGMTVEAFVALLKTHVGTEHDADDVCDVTVVGDYNGLIATGTQVTVTAKNPLGVDSVTYDIVVMGDTNCDGQVSSGDASLIYQHFCGVLSTPLNEYQLLAGDTNGNGRLESGDANKIFAKYVGADYTTVLEQEDQ